MTKITRMGIAALLVVALMFTALPGPRSAQAEVIDVVVSNLTCSSATVTATITRTTASPGFESAWAQVAAGVLGDPPIATLVDEQTVPAGDAGSSHTMNFNVTFPAQAPGTNIIISVWQWWTDAPTSTNGGIYIQGLCPSTPPGGDETPPPPPGDNETPTPPPGPAPMTPAVLRSAPPALLPGPDMVEMPSWSVMGRFVEWTELLYAPDLSAQTNRFMEPGQTLWVLGLDESGEFRQVVFSGGYYWVPVASMAPIDEAPWYGRGLPGEIVDYTS